VRPAYLVASHARISRDHGSVAHYLREAAGLNEERRARLIATLTE